MPSRDRLCILFFWKRLHVAEGIFLYLFSYPPSILPYLSPHESKQLIEAGKYNSFFPYYPYDCRMQYICPYISIAHMS